MTEDRALEFLERTAGFDPELVDERLTRVLVDVERFRLPARPVEGDHQLLAQPFAQRVLGDERAELGDQVVVAPAAEIGLDPQLDRREPDLLEPGDGGLGEALVCEVAEGGAPPERQGVAQPLRRLGRQATIEQGPPLVHEPLEAVEIERFGLHAEDVARRSGRHHVMRKRLPDP